ncbi:hypothetical protein F0562_025268 [Nyssa sinensis]|uniref:Uncharacterized protein n=1 Tax=Nyssa sinensis TaxID=561372 RepID=A0A5J5BDS7_9ASTE|nr:hypothetical protein F0562_025268 [Nyssa sinensis]
MFGNSRLNLHLSHPLSSGGYGRSGDREVVNDSSHGQSTTERMGAEHGLGLIHGDSGLFWCSNLFQKLGNLCGGFVAMDKDTKFKNHLCCARVLVRRSKRDVPASIRLKVREGGFEIPVWFEGGPRYWSPTEIKASPSDRNDRPLRLGGRHAWEGHETAVLRIRPDTSHMNEQTPFSNFKPHLQLQGNDPLEHNQQIKHRPNLNRA